MENVTERIIVSSRYLVMSAVFFGLVGATALFIIASCDIVESVVVMCKYYFAHDNSIDLHVDGVALIIGAIDLYLIALVLLIFSFGIYELFISKIDALESIDLKDINILTIKSLDQLKDKLAKVILMVLVVSFFQRVLHMKFTLPLEMLYLAISILALGIALYFMNKGGHH